MSESKGPGFTVSDPEGGAEQTLPQIDFSTFVLSLATSAYVHLGLASPGGETDADRNLPLARQTIDTLAMLGEKTRGNLTAEEAKLVETVLYELRMRFVELSG